MGPAGPIGRIVDRPQNISGSMQKLFLIELNEPAIEPASSQRTERFAFDFFFFLIFQVKTMSFCLIKYCKLMDSNMGRRSYKGTTLPLCCHCDYFRY